MKKLAVGYVLGMAVLALQTCRADLGDTREQLIERYGKPDGEEENRLYFSSADAPQVVSMSAAGKSSRELFSYTEDVGQKHVMEILSRNSKGKPWRATKLDYPDTEMVWRYTQIETNVRASYTRDDGAHDAIYYFLTIGL